MVVIVTDLIEKEIESWRAGSLLPVWALKRVLRGRQLRGVMIQRCHSCGFFSDRVGQSTDKAVTWSTWSKAPSSGPPTTTIDYMIVYARDENGISWIVSRTVQVGRPPCFPQFLFPLDVGSRWLLICDDSPLVRWKVSTSIRVGKIEKTLSRWIIVLAGRADTPRNTRNYFGWPDPPCFYPTRSMCSVREAMARSTRLPMDTPSEWYIIGENFFECQQTLNKPPHTLPCTHSITLLH